jgi:hypothetical protein
MNELSAAGRNYAQIKEEPPVDPVVGGGDQYVGGVTAQSVAGQQRPVQSESDFFARGGLTNTANDAMNKIAQRKQQRFLQQAYEQYLEMGEKGADVVYNDAIAKYSTKDADGNVIDDEVKTYLPPKDVYYDDNGRFMSHQYAQAIYVGVNKYKEKHDKDLEDLKTEQANVAAAGAIPGSPDQEEAARRATVAAAGHKTGEMVDKQVGAVQTRQQQETNDRLIRHMNDMAQARELDRKSRERVAGISKSGRIGTAQTQALKAQLTAMAARGKEIEEMRDHAMGSNVGRDFDGKLLFEKSPEWMKAQEKAQELISDYDKLSKQLDEIEYTQTGGALGSAPPRVAGQRGISDQNIPAPPSSIALPGAATSQPAPQPGVKDRFAAFKAKNYQSPTGR